METDQSIDRASKKLKAPINYYYLAREVRAGCRRLYEERDELGGAAGEPLDGCGVEAERAARVAEPGRFVHVLVEPGGAGREVEHATRRARPACAARRSASAAQSDGSDRNADDASERSRSSSPRASVA